MELTFGEDGKGQLEIASRPELRAWLEANADASGGVWLVTFKVIRKDLYVAYDEIVEELLCFGWVDSKPGKVDDQRSKLWIAPRKPGSLWSAINKARIEQLIEAGLMRPLGLSKVEAAKKDGTWFGLDEVEAGTVPPDLHEAFSRFPGSGANFTNFPRSARRGILEWIVQAKTAETRAKRVEETARLAQDNLRANQWRKPKAT